MTWMSPAAIGQGRVSPGLLAALGGSPLGITQLSEATLEVRPHLSWMQSGLPGGKTLSPAASPSFSCDPLVTAALLAPYHQLGPWPPWNTPGLSPAGGVQASGQTLRAQGWPGWADMNHLRCLRPPLCPLSL